MLVPTSVSRPSPRLPPNKPSPSSPDPKPIAALAGQHITLVAAGFYSSFVMNDAGDVYAWGCNPRQVPPGHPQQRLVSGGNRSEIGIFLS